MKQHIFLASPHMSDEGYEKEFIKEAFDTNWMRLHYLPARRRSIWL